MAVHDTARSGLRRAESIYKKIGRVPVLLILLWFTTVWWGERLVFKNSIGSCAWPRWESWDAEARPHHVLFVADPQLVDPHTYPGRPWPLSTLTILYTDLYLRRSYRLLLETLQPDTTLFLGDLFDGGREWGAARYKSPEERYKQYGTNFWLREYTRFMNIFVTGWQRSSMHLWSNEGGRRLITSLPGNHDLGFAGGINAQVKSRFDAHFGPLNRVDVLGNHSFVSIDTVSLSAMDQVDPKTGSSGAGDGSAADTKISQIWKPVEDFLKTAPVIREQAVRHQLRSFDSISRINGLPAARAKFEPQVLDARRSSEEQKGATKDPLHVSTSQFPTIVLSHVPLYRGEHVDCGPLREKGKSLLLAAGYQYQNVLTPLISRNIVDHLDADQITQVYSGDDHDYCEVEHNEFNGRIKEITVKSISWAMGVRKPGVQLASLWNPVDMDSVTRTSDTSADTPRNTVQNHLCLLPDQLGIFIRYAGVFALTLLSLSARAVLYRPSLNDRGNKASYSTSEKEKNTPLLPTSRKITPPTSPSLRAEQANDDNSYHQNDYYSSSSHSSASSGSSARLAPATVRTSKLGGYGNVPPSSRSHSPVKEEVSTGKDGDTTDDWGTPLGQLKFAKHTHVQAHRNHWLFSFYRAQTKMAELRRSIIHVGTPVLLFYAWLLWNG